MPIGERVCSRPSSLRMTPRADMNRESYDAVAHQWDETRLLLSDSEKRILDVLLQRTPAGANALDLGCGTGRPIAEYLVSQQLHVTGVDQSAAMLQLARNRLPEQHWILSSLENFEPAGEFAAVIAWDSLFHIPREEHAAILARVRAVIPRGGRLALTVGGSEHPAFTDTMLGHTFFYDSHSPEAAMALLSGLQFEIILSEFLNLPTTGRDKGRFAIVAEAV
jgi:ubiquinone/menaquinone biosynthesis C-methylase UbiE